MSVIQNAVQWALDIAKDNSHGYSQAQRFGPDFDCSSFVISAYQSAGLKLREAGASYTGNMKPAFLRCGFEDVTAQINLNNGAGLQPGDVCLNEASHVVMAVGNGKIVHARSSEGNDQTGDQSGNEIRVQGYWNWSPDGWDCILRYRGADVQSGPATSGAPASSASGSSQTGKRVLKKGMVGDDVKELQELLIAAGFLGKEGADKIFGNNTYLAVIRFQDSCGLSVDGQAGPQTLSSLQAVVGLPQTGGGKAEQPAAQSSAKKSEEWPLRLLKVGSKGPGVEVVEAVLKARGYDVHYVSGTFGTRLEEQVKEFQKDEGLDPDGIVGDLTRAALFRF